MEPHLNHRRGHVEVGGGSSRPASKMSQRPKTSQTNRTDHSSRPDSRSVASRHSTRSTGEHIEHAEHKKEKKYVMRGGFRMPQGNLSPEVIEIMDTARSAGSMSTITTAHAHNTLMKQIKTLPTINQS